MPEAFPENRDAVKIFLFCKDQYIFTPSGKIIDMNFQAIETAMMRLEIKNKNDCFKKVVALGRHFIKQT